jgi:hypothetical protein
MVGEERENSLLCVFGNVGHVWIGVKELSHSSLHATENPAARLHRPVGSLAGLLTEPPRMQARNEFLCGSLQNIEFLQVSALVEKIRCAVCVSQPAAQRIFIEH